MPRRARIRYRMGRKHSGPGAGGRPCEPSPKGKNVKERAPRVGGDALSNPPGCGKMGGPPRYNAPALRLFRGEQKRRREHSGPRLHRAHAAAHCAADASRYADSRRTDLFPGVKGELQVCYRADGQCGCCGTTFLVPQDPLSLVHYLWSSNVLCSALPAQGCNAALEAGSL